MSSFDEVINEIINEPISYFNNLDKSVINKILKDEVDTSISDDSVYFSICCLYLFITDNFTGPSVMERLDNSKVNEILEKIPGNYIMDINIDGEEIHNNAKCVEFLWLAKNIIEKYNGPDLWISRVSIVHQKVLSGPSLTLKNKIMKSAAGIELAIAYRQFGEFDKFFEQLEIVKKDIKLEFSLTGKMGKKTKFQQDSQSQLVLDVKNCESIRRSDQKLSLDQFSSNNREIKLDDDINLLERPKMDEIFTLPKLTNEELAVFLLQTHAFTDKEARQETLDEQKLPFLQSILELKPDYDIVTCAIFEKSIIEQNSHSTQHRAALQLQSIIDDFNAQNSECRTKNFFIIEHPAIWSVRREMGLQMLKIGAAKSASKIFVEYKMWDELGLCAMLLNDPSIAVDVLEKVDPPTPLVLSVLGEQKCSKEILLQAWELSNKRYARSVRSLAKIFLREKNWKEASEYFEISLKINPLYPDAWFSCGCSYMMLNNHEKAIICFQEVISQRDDDSETYSNLAACFTTLERHQEAHKAISQAIRHERRRYRLWENFINISKNAGKYSDMMHGLEELNRYQPKWVNNSILFDALNAFSKNSPDLLQRLLVVIEKISQSASCGSGFWELYGDINSAIGNYQAEYDNRINCIKALDNEDKITDIEVFEILVSAIEKLLICSKKLEGKSRTVKSRIKATLKKYENDYASTEPYKKLLQISESNE